MDGYSVLAFGAFQGHSWVCDGYRNLINCPLSDSWFHMNWGWGEYWPYMTDDGWYVEGGFTPYGGNNFNFSPGVILDLHQ